MPYDRLAPLARYALTALAVVAAPAVAPAVARAAVVTRTVNARLTATPDGPNNTYALDVDADGVPDFTFTTIIGIPEDPGFASFAQITPPFATVNGAVVDAATNDGFPTVSRLAAGTVVGPASVYSGNNDNGNLRSAFNDEPPTGNFAATSGYVGFRFASGAATRYGFAYVSVRDLFATTDPLAVTIGQVGYESTPNTAVTLPPAGGVPEPTAAAGVAAAGLLLGRRRRPGRGAVA